MLSRFPIFRYASRYSWVLVISVLGLLLLGSGEGTVISLSASGGGNYSENITINVVVRAETKISTNNFYFEIRSPEGLVVDTHSTNPPDIEGGQTYSYSWNSNNSSYPSIGNYTIFFCWSSGNSQNCNIAQTDTGFYSVPTFGTVLSVVALVLLGVWLWGLRQKLSRKAAAA